MAQIILNLTDELHTKFKVRCTENKTTMTSELIKLIEKFINEKEEVQECQTQNSST